MPDIEIRHGRVVERLSGVDLAQAMYEAQAISHALKVRVEVYIGGRFHMSFDPKGR